MPLQISVLCFYSLLSSWQAGCFTLEIETSDHKLFFSVVPQKWAGMVLQLFGELHLLPNSMMGKECLSGLVDVLKRCLAHLVAGLFSPENGEGAGSS